MQRRVSLFFLLVVVSLALLAVSGCSEEEPAGAISLDEDLADEFIEYSLPSTTARECSCPFYSELNSCLTTVDGYYSDLKTMWQFIGQWEASKNDLALKLTNVCQLIDDSKKPEYCK